MADDVRLICWTAVDRLGFDIEIWSLSGQAYLGDRVFAQLDTGFSGEILIPFQTYEALRLDLWAVEQSLVGVTVTGEKFNLLEARVDVLIPRTGKRYRVLVQSFVGNTRLLIGRAFLRRLKLVLDGPGAQMCIMAAT